MADISRHNASTRSFEAGLSPKSRLIRRGRCMSESRCRRCRLGIPLPWISQRPSSGETSGSPSRCRMSCGPQASRAANSKSSSRGNCRQLWRSQSGPCASIILRNSYGRASRLLPKSAATAAGRTHRTPCAFSRNASKRPCRNSGGDGRDVARERTPPHFANRSRKPPPLGRARSVSSEPTGDQMRAAGSKRSSSALLARKVEAFLEKNPALRSSTISCGGLSMSDM